MGESPFHLCYLMDTPVHFEVGKALMEVFPKLALDYYEGEEYFGELCVCVYVCVHVWCVCMCTCVCACICHCVCVCVCVWCVCLWCVGLCEHECVKLIAILAAYESRAHCFCLFVCPSLHMSVSVSLSLSLSLMSIFFCNVMMVSMLYVHARRTSWKIGPWPKISFSKYNSVQFSSLSSHCI